MDHNIVSSTIADLLTTTDSPRFILSQIDKYFPFIKENIEDLKIILALLTGVFFLLLTIVAVKINRLSARKLDIVKIIDPPDSIQSGTSARWIEVQKHITSTREAEWKFAVIEADKVVDEILKNSFPGETMGERLLNITKGQLETLDGLWEAHKIRNRLVHDVNYFLRYAEAKRAVILYERTLKELQAI